MYKVTGRYESRTVGVNMENGDIWNKGKITE